MLGKTQESATTAGNFLHNGDSLNDDVEVSFRPNCVDVLHNIRVIKPLHQLDFTLRCEMNTNG